MPLTPGTTLGPYEVLAAIGAGGMGEVYKARDTKLDRDVALNSSASARRLDSHPGCLVGLRTCATALEELPHLRQCDGI